MDRGFSLLHALLGSTDPVHQLQGASGGHTRLVCAAICTLLCKMTGRPVTRAVASLPTLASNSDESGPLSQCNTICIEYQSFGFSLDTAGECKCHLSPLYPGKLKWPRFQHFSYIWENPIVFGSSSRLDGCPRSLCNRTCRFSEKKYTNRMCTGKVFGSWLV